MIQAKFINSEHIGNYAEIDSQRIHYIEQGEGEPLILVHTIGQSLYTWRLLIDRLSQDYHVFALDLIGHGYSSKPVGEYIVSDHSAMLAQFMDSLQISSAHFMAFSLGSMYVLDFARRFSERTGRLVLISPGGITPSMPSFVRGMDSRLLGWLYALVISERTVASVLEYSFFDQTFINEEVIREYYLPFADSNTRRAVLKCVQNFDDEQVIANLRDIDNEVLMLLGNDDRCHEVAISDIFSVALKHNKTEIVRNCGHIIQEEKPEKLLEHALEFLQNGIV